MIKIFLIILAIYLLYYAGNIVYDLFLKKDGLTKQSESEEYVLTAFAEENTNQIKAVSIDDVEHLNTPASFNKKELFSTTDEEFDEPHDLEHWRQKFEFEQDIDAFETRPENNRHSTEINELKEYHSVEQENIQYDEIKETLTPNSKTLSHKVCKLKSQGLDFII